MHMKFYEHTSISQARILNILAKNHRRQSFWIIALVQIRSYCLMSERIHVHKCGAKSERNTKWKGTDFHSFLNLTHTLVNTNGLKFILHPRVLVVAEYFYEKPNAFSIFYWFLCVFFYINFSCQQSSGTFLCASTSTSYAYTMLFVNLMCLYRVV